MKAITEGSVFRAFNSGHHGQLRKVIRVRDHTVTVVSTGRGVPKQHANKVYTVPIDKFLRKHELVKLG